MYFLFLIRATRFSSFAAFVPEYFKSIRERIKTKNKIKNKLKGLSALKRQFDPTGSRLHVPYTHSDIKYKQLKKLSYVL